MKKGIIIFLSLSLIVCVCFAFKNRKEKTTTGSKGFSLIELFTSEGCSSCPPAEEVLDKLINKARTESLPVYVIEFHVDYWDYLGWKDTFALNEYSQRQQNYGDFLKLNSIYTPQAIVNGQIEMVGSDEDKVNAAVAKELQNQSSVIIECKANKTANSKIEISYNITGNISASTLNFAVVESNLTANIKKGENAHKTLTHNNVARVFKSIKPNSSTGKITMEAPHVNLSNAKVICFMQNTENMKIIGATEVGIVQ